jgi:2-hydroxy-6-oxonona-2,4-dienedioate hydrolase
MGADATRCEHCPTEQMQAGPLKPADIPAGFISTLTAVLGHQVHALVSGSQRGKPGQDQAQRQIVMIHGALASRRYLLPTAKLLADNFQVFVPEMPGHGASSRPRHALSVEDQAEVLFEWFRLNGLTQTHIFANSYGCQVVAQLTATHPEIVQRLILTGPTADPTARSIPKQMYRLYIDGFAEPSGGKAQLFADLRDMGIPIAFQTVQRMLEDDIRPRLSQIKCQTLVLRGGKDTLAPQLWTEEVARRISNSRFCVIPGAPHCVNYATPSQLTSIVMNFINEP